MIRCCSTKKKGLFLSGPAAATAHPSSRNFVQLAGRWAPVSASPNKNKPFFFVVGVTSFLLLLSFPAKAELQKVRVLIAENQKTIRLTVKDKYVIRALPSLQVVKKGRGLTEMEVVGTPTGFRLGKDSWAGKGFQIEPMTQRDLFLNRSRFRGVIRILKNPKGMLYAINELDVEGYLYGVLPHEVAPWWPMEALKSQAVAARTYALYQVSVSKPLEYDLKSNTSSQVYGGSTTERQRTKRAVDLTKGQTLTYQGKIFPAYFHATCAGITAGAAELWKIDIPPLAGKVECGFCRISPHWHWKAKIPLAEIEEKMQKNSRPVGRILKIEMISQTPSHRAGSLKITGTAGQTVMAAKDFRIWLGGDRIRSLRFTVQVREDAAEFDGKGWGHGVGLCQWGALGQSLLGHDYQKILSFYYPKSEIHGAS
jgi:stage II sporulation protein D